MFQPSGGCLHHCKHIAFTLVGLRECDTVNLSSLPTFIFQPPPPYHKCNDCLACLTVVHVLQLWITCTIMSVVKPTPRLRAYLDVASFP